MPVGAASAEVKFDRLAARASRAALASSTKGQGSSPCQPRGATRALALISFTILPSASLRVSPSSTAATDALSGGGRSQGGASVASSATPKAAAAQAMPLSIRLAMTYLRDWRLRSTSAACGGLFVGHGAG